MATNGTVEVREQTPVSPLRWAVIGMGRAGQARARLIDGHPQCELIARVSRRPGLGNASVEEVWQADNIDAVVIATENARHGALALEGLRAGKHVLVEYPLANTAKEVKELSDLALQRGLVLHLEMIGLLTTSHRATQQWLATQSMSEIQLHFHGGFYRWVEDEAQAGRWGQLAIARLHALDEWAGPLELQRVHIESKEDGYALSVVLTGARGERIQFNDSRQTGQGRSRQILFSSADGAPCTPPEVPGLPNLFEQDLQVCIDQIHGVRDSGYVDLNKAVEMTELAEAISRDCRLLAAE